MTRAFCYALIGLLTSWVVGCRPVYEAPIPYDSSNKPGTGLFRPAIRRSLEGVYAVSDGGGQFGREVALKWSYVHDGTDTVHAVTILTGVDAGFFNVDINQSVDSLRLTGFWRTLVNQGTGQAALTVVRKRRGNCCPTRGRRWRATRWPCGARSIPVWGQLLSRLC